MGNKHRLWIWIAIGLRRPLLFAVQKHSTGSNIKSYFSPPTLSQGNLWSELVSEAGQGALNLLPLTGSLFHLPASHLTLRRRRRKWIQKYNNIIYRCWHHKQTLSLALPGGGHGERLFLHYLLQTYVEGEPCVKFKMAERLRQQQHLNPWTESSAAVWVGEWVSEWKISEVSYH